MIKKGEFSTGVHFLGKRLPISLNTSPASTCLGPCESIAGVECVRVGYGTMEEEWLCNGFASLTFETELNPAVQSNSVEQELHLLF